MEKINNKSYLIYGVKASGKTTYAEKLSEKLSLEFIDLDKKLLEIYNKNTVFELYNYLQNEFRVTEYKQFYNLVNNITKNTVLSVGGSTLLYKEIKIKDIKKKFKFILIDTDFEEIYKRIQKQNTVYKRYSYKELKELYGKRIKLFRSWADKIIK